MELIIEKKFGRFAYDKDLRCIFHFWKGFLLLEEVMQVREATTPIMVELGLINVIADHREMDLFSDDISEYIANVWIPEQERIGIKNIFVIMSSESLTKMAAEEMHDEAKKKSSINIYHLSSLEIAIEKARQFSEAG